MTKRPSGRKKPPSDQTYPKVATTFGTNLAKAREAAGISQLDIASAAGRARSYVSAIESGRWNLTLRTAEALAEAVGQTLSDLLNPAWGGPGNAPQVSAKLPHSSDSLAIEMPSPVAFEVARVAALHLKRPVPLIEPRSRVVIAVVSDRDS